MSYAHQFRQSVKRIERAINSAMSFGVPARANVKLLEARGDLTKLAQEYGAVLEGRRVERDTAAQWTARLELFTITLFQHSGMVLGSELGRKAIETAMRDAWPECAPDEGRLMTHTDPTR